MPKAAGRPRKYAGVIHLLNDDDLYSPASIARIAQAEGWLERFLEKEPNEALVVQRLRISCIRQSNGFPEAGDGQVKIWGQPPVPGWFGWRWKTR